MKQPNSTGFLHDAGVDWLTITWEKNDPKITEIFNVISRFQHGIAQTLDDVVPWKWEGYTGHEAGGVAIGEREDGIIVRATGRQARTVALILKERKLGGKASRIDFQTTLKTTDSNERYLSKVRRRVETATAKKPVNRRRNVTDYQVRGSRSGVVIGSRHSENHSRIYDKSLEQKGRVGPNLVRMETEYKGKRARNAWEKYQAARCPHKLTRSIISTEMKAVGIPMDWLKGAEKVEFPSTYERTDDERRFNWLEKHVRPTVLKLVARHGREAVLQALGLDESQNSATLPETASLDGAEKTL